MYRKEVLEGAEHGITGILVVPKLVLLEDGGDGGVL